MRAHLGDHLVIDGVTSGGTRRDGEIVALHHSDGTPPYDVRWSDTDEVTLVFPGPDAHVRPVEHAPGSPDTSRGRERVAGPPRVRRTCPPTPVTSADAWPPSESGRG